MLKNYLRLLTKDYPSTRQLGDLSESLNNLLSFKTVPIKAAVIERASLAIQSIYKAAHSKAYLEELKNTLIASDQELFRARAQPSSALMAYDFHYSEELDKLSLIEINTNASAFLISEILYRVDGGAKMNWESARQDLFNSFSNEAAFWQKNLKSVALIDANCVKQKMFIEFLMYKDFFKNHNVDCEILDFDQLTDPDTYDLIYNRYTDFTFMLPESKALREAYLNGTAIFSPHPSEYLRLSDKRALSLLAKHIASDVFLQSVLFQNVTDWDALWDARKKYVFKPQRSHGAKAVYRGESISRKKFEEIQKLDFLAQEYAPPGEIDGFKFDLRFFVYKDTLQLVVARLYKGQVLNFSSPGGGLAAIEVVY
jgi:hypothetical protein